MSETPQVLLQHHLKKLRLPTFNSEYAKLARPGGGRRQNTNLRASARGALPRARTMSSICCGSANWN